MKAADYLKPEVIREISRLDLRARFIVQGFIAGLHASPYRGFSVEFSGHRKYNPGDDLKYIDWNVYARTDRFCIKEFRAETNLSCVLAVDFSESMGYSSGEGLSKSDYAVCLAAALCYMMISQQDAVGLAVFDQSIRSYLPPRSKRKQFTDVLSELVRQEPAGKTNIARVLGHIARLMKGKGLVILFSDLLADFEEVREGLHLLRGEGHDVIIFHLLDSAEVRFPFDGIVDFEDVESGEKVRADARAIRAAYLERLRNFIERYRVECANARIDYVQLETSIPFDRALMSYLVARRARF